MSNPQVSIKGPFDQSNTPQGPATPLYLTEEGNPNTDTDTKKQDIPGKDDDKALLAPLDGQTEFSYTGVFNANRLSRAYTNKSQVNAVREWLYELETLCLSKQGKGFRLDDNSSGFVLDPTAGTGVLVEEAEWTVSAGEGLYGEWRLNVQKADGVQPADVNLRNNKITSERTNTASNSFSTEKLFVGTPSGSPTEYELGSVQEMKYTRKLDLNVQQMIYNSDIPQTGLPESGVKGTFRVQGIVTSKDVSSLSALVNNFNTSIHGDFVFVQESVTDRVFAGAVSSSTATLESGDPNKIEYTVEVDIGSPDSFDFSN